MIELRVEVKLTAGANTHYWEVILPVSEAEATYLSTNETGIEGVYALAAAIMTTLRASNPNTSEEDNVSMA